MVTPGAPARLRPVGDYALPELYARRAGSWRLEPTVWREGRPYLHSPKFLNGDIRLSRLKKERKEIEDLRLQNAEDIEHGAPVK